MAFVTWGGNYCIAQEVTLDFTQNGWKLPAKADNKTEGKYTYDGITISFDVPENFYFNSVQGSNYLMLKSTKTAVGKLTLPAFNFAVEKIEVVGNSGASGKTMENIYVGNTAVSTAKKGSDKTNAFLIDKQYQAAGTIYTLQVSAANAQITYIKIYKRAVDLTATTLTLSAIPTEPIAIGGTFSSTPTLKAGEQTLSDKTITWSSDNKDVATVDANGTVTGVGLGKAKITATFAGDNVYETSTASYEIKVKGAPELSFPKTSYNIFANAPFTAPVLTKSPADVVVTYSSSDDKVATVDASTGKVSIVGAGTAKITATSQVTDVYEEAQASYDLVVTKFTPALSFPQTSYTIEVGDAFAPKLEGLPEGVTPAYTSSKEEVATVDAATGEVKIVGVGTTTITVTSPETDIYEGATASYVLNVKAGIYKVEFDFTSNNWGLPTNYKTEEASYTNGAGYTITFGKSNSGHRIMGTDPECNLIFGKQDATLSLPAFPFAVSKIKVFGRDKASSKVKQNIFVGEEAVSTETTNATTDHIYEIKEAFQAAGNIYTLKVTNAYNTQITKIVVYAKDETVAGAINIATEEGFGTFYTDKNYVLPQGLTAFGYTSIEGNNTLTKSVEYVAVDIVPANTAVVVKGAKGSYNYYNTEETATKTIEKNLLKGVTTDTRIEAASGVKRYILTRADDGILAFYRTNTGNINVKANRAYLEVPTAMAVASFSLEGSATGINNVVTTAAKQGIYTISGVRLNATTTKELPAGIYIVDGKKVIVK